MQPITTDAVVIGVDTHKDVHVAVALSELGARLGDACAPATAEGYRQLASWALGHGAVHAFGIEGTGSYGAGLSRALSAQGFRVVEVNRSNRQLRRQRGKSDTVDAEAAARAVLAGQADAPPKAGDGEVEMIRHLKIVRDTALKSRTQAMVTLKTLLINAPQPLREQFIALSGRMTLIRSLAALRALARRWLALDTEIREHDAALEELVRKRAPALMEAPGVSTLTVAEMLVVLGDNPERIRSEAAFAKLCGVCPVPASSGKTTRHRLNRGGNRRANAALYRVAITRMRSHPPTLAYIKRRTAEGKSPRKIRRCLKRYIAREIFHHLCARQPPVALAPDAP